MAHTRPNAVAPDKILGYLNFSDGRPDPRVVRQFDDALDQAGALKGLHDALLAEADRLEASGQPAFKDLSQARRAVHLALKKLPPAYMRFHADLFGVRPADEVFNGFLVARAFETVLAVMPLESDDALATKAAIKRLNDYVGHRPVPVLETRAKTDVYSHEKFRPVPLYVSGAGVASGRFHLLVTRAVEILRGLDPAVTAEAFFDFELLDEWGYDPRPYDHNHPVNRRPNYLFGEWDPHQIDLNGFFRRFVVRECILDAMIARARRPDDSLDEELILESAAVLAGTVLMASGFSGSGPATHDSDAKLSSLTPQIAKYRDRFYTHLLGTIPGGHGKRLRDESAKLRQPFGGARQHLNLELARQRAAQIQERELALAFAQLGFPEAARQRAARIATPSVRFAAEIRLRHTLAENALARRDAAPARQSLPEVEDLLKRGIRCGAIVDPWNILGFGGLFPLFQAREDSIRDPRCEELIEAADRQLDLYSRTLADLAAKGDGSGTEEVASAMEGFAAWWDRFATAGVGDLPQVRGRERAAAARHIGRALAAWEARSREPDPSPGTDIAFWRKQKNGFTSAAAYAQVIDALMRHRDWRAALTLLIAWLADAGEVELDDGSHNFRALAGRWVDSVLALPGDSGRDLIDRFFLLLEPNAEDFWGVPTLEYAAPPPKEGRGGEFSAAFEGMTFRDSTDDGNEGSVAGDPPGSDDFPLESVAERVEERLHFVASVAKWWQAAARSDAWRERPPEAAGSWVGLAGEWALELEARVGELHRLAVPAPGNGLEEAYQFDRRRNLRDSLADLCMGTWTELHKARRELAALGGEAPDGGPEWEADLVRLQAMVALHDRPGVRAALPALLDRFGKEPLLFVPLTENGRPAAILRARDTLACLEMLLDRLPRLGLIRETYQLVKLAKAMEQNGPQEGRKVSEFDRFFRIGLRAVVETLLDAASAWGAGTREQAGDFAAILRRVAESFLQLWVAHSQTLRLSVLEGVAQRTEWEGLRDFVKKFGRPIFTTGFMQYANLRAILLRGVGRWLDERRAADDAALEDLFAAIDDQSLPRNRAEFFLEIILQAALENHEEYRDYNSTTSHSDYGDNLYVLLDFLRVKVSYDRYAWRLRPLMLAHEILCRKGYLDVAARWRDNVAESSRKLADDLLEELAGKESEHSLKLRMVRDKVEEKFALPMELDRLCALVEPAARAATRGADERSPEFAKLFEPLEQFTAKPTGSGLDAPAWLRRLDAEVRKARQQAQQPAPVVVPGQPEPISLEELNNQLREWETGL